MHESIPRNPETSIRNKGIRLAREAEYRFALFMGGMTDDPGYVPMRAEDRLHNYFNGDTPADDLRELTHVMQYMSEDEQADLLMYFSGHPESNFTWLSRGDLARTRARLAINMVRFGNVMPPEDEIPDARDITGSPVSDPA